MADTQINVKIVGSSNSAEQALDRVAKKAEQSLGKSISDSLDNVKAKAQKVFGVEIPGLMNAAKSGAAFAGAAIGIEAAGRALKDMAVSAIKTTDQLTQLRARINLINDGTQSTAEIMDKVYQAANRSRGSYLDMADSVAKLNMLAKDAFNSNDEAIYFVEQLNKQFKIAGASVEETSSAMYQLTQAMAAGKLQGDEFHSIMENAPMLAQAIASEMGLTVGQLKEMSSQGLITADIIKNALFNSAEETNAKFAEIPLTFQDIGTQLQNNLITAFQPVMEQIGSMASSDLLTGVLNELAFSFKVVAAAAQVAIATIKAAFAGLSVTIGVIKNVVTSFVGVFTTSMPAVRVAVVGVTTAFVAYKATLLLCSTQTAALTVKMVALKVAQVASATATRAHVVVMAAFRAAMAASATASAFLAAVLAGVKAAFMAARSGALAMAAAQKVVNLVMRANPVGLLISVLMTLVTIFATAAAAGNGFGNTLSSVFSTIVHTAVWGVNKIIEALNWLIAKLNSVGDKVAKFFGGTFTAIQQVDTISADSAQDIVNTAGDIMGQITSGLSGGGGGGDIDTSGFGGGGDYDTRGGKGKGGKGGGGGKGSKGSGKDLAKEAKQVHEKILQSFLEMQGNQVELVELQYQKERDELEKSKAANANYQQDLERLNEVYADKRIKAKQEEMAKLRAIETGIRDMQKNFAFSTAGKDSTGSVSPAMQLAKDYIDHIDEIEDRYAEMSDNFIKMDAMQQQKYIDTLKQRGVEFEMSGDGQISFEKLKNEEMLALQDEFNKKALQQHTDLVNEKYAIDEAMRTQNFEALQAALTDEYVAEQQNYELKKALLEEYKQAVMDAHWNGQQVLFDAANAGLDSLQGSISGLIQGTTTLMQTFQNLGKAILKTIADSVAQWIAGQIKQAVFGKMMAAQQAATGTAAANAQYPAWAALAQQVSMATFGASAIAGNAAWSANTAAGSALSLANSATSFASIGGGRLELPKMANGGVAYGSTYAEIGEGKYKEAVLPLSESTYDEMGAGIARAGGGATGGITFNVSAMDAHSFGDWLENSAGRSLRQFLVNQNREFVATEGTW